MSEEQIIFYCLDEPAAAADIESHLQQCADCRAELAAIRRTLNLAESLEVPRRSPDYGTEVWRRLQPRLGLRTRPAWLSWFGWRRLAPAAGVAALVVVAFLAGRYTPRQNGPGTVAQTGNSSADRALLLTVGDHLDQTQRALLELANSDASELPAERRTAEQLLLDNRLYRQSLQRSGDRRLSALLEELERFLTEAANARPDELKNLQRRLAEEGILFELRVTNAKLHERERQIVQDRGKTL